ncbi:urease accessory protein UreD [Streptomyces piniterrae]|uniref:Urease accessory protein UreD n=1 Tax=Streptomyces piniterrae TaxID=2571125 RepID=A0A4V5MME5_9ACTN|nr:urease accessory protein UreD [Streptomyces piniterrae]
MSAPPGGDRLRMEATAQQGTALHIISAAATLAVRGLTPEPATYDVQLTVAEDAQLHWRPEPSTCAADSDLRQPRTIDLARTARLVLREEQILGRTGESPGRVTTRLTVRRGGYTLLDQQAAYGPGAPGREGPAVLAGHRVTGQLLVVDPAFEKKPPGVRLLGGAANDGFLSAPPARGRTPTELEWGSAGWNRLGQDPGR